MMMKKIEETRFLCLDFINCDLSRNLTIEGLVKTFLHPPTYRYLQSVTSEPGCFDRDRSKWKRKLSENIETLREIQGCIADFVDRSVGRIQSKTIAGETRIKNSIVSEAEGLSHLFGSVSDPVISFVAYGLFGD
jgi:hypothetical protein